MFAMTFLPIVERELRSHARRSAAHWSRWAVALVASLWSVQVLFAYSPFYDLASGGARAYELLLGIGFVVACSAALLTADALSAERREGTLGLLFLTDLKGYDMVRELRVLSTLPRVQLVRVALAGFAILACLQWSVLRLGSAAGALMTFRPLMTQNEMRSPVSEWSA